MIILEKFSLNFSGLFPKVFPIFPKILTKICFLLLPFQRLYQKRNKVDNPNDASNKMLQQLLNQRKQSPKTSTEKPKTSTEKPKTSTEVPRQVFLLCGRRRKKSKTYLIGTDPFEMSKNNYVAKLKSNMIGTHFRAIRLVSLFLLSFLFSLFSFSFSLLFLSSFFFLLSFTYFSSTFSLDFVRFH